MTAIVGVLCRDGVVIGSDSSATFGSSNPGANPQPTIEQPTSKLNIIGDRVVVAGSGEVGLSQRFDRIVTDFDSRGLWQPNHHIDLANAIAAEAINDFSRTGITPGIIRYSALTAFYSSGQFRLCEFAVLTFQPEFKDENIWFVSIGSGQPITDPILALMRSIFWDDGMPSVQDAILPVTWTLQHVIDVNPGGINGPMRIAVLQEDSQQSGNPVARILDDNELLEPQEHIETLKREMKDRAIRLHQTDDVPQTPRPNISAD